MKLLWKFLWKLMKLLLSNTHNSIHLVSYSSTVIIIPGTNFHPQRAGINLQAICLVSFPPGSLSYSTW